MVTCKSCGRRYHYCTSCEYIDYMSGGYCSEECWAKGDEYKEQMIFFKNLYSPLDKNKRENFKKWFTEIYSDNYYSFIKKWMEEIDEGT